VLFFAVDEVVFLEDFAADDSLLDLVGVDDVFLEVVFELEAFGLVLELFTFFEAVAFGVEDVFAVDFLVTFGFDVFFGWVFVCANVDEERPIAIRRARRVFIV